MKKFELVVLFIIAFTSPLFAAHQDGPAGTIASAIGALMFFGILALYRGIKQRNKNKKNE